MVKDFVTLYDMEIKESGVTVIGPLIRGEEKQEDTTFNERWNFIEVYEGWWNLANTGWWDFVEPWKATPIV